MKKRVLAAALSAVMAAALAACGASAPAAQQEAVQEAAEEQVEKVEEAAAEQVEAVEEAVEEAATAVDPSEFSVGLVTDVGGVNDGSFNQSAWEGLQRAGKDLGIEVNYLESKGDADYTPNIEAFMDEDYDLIICVGYMLADATRAAAEANPDQQFAIIDDSSCSDLPNVTCLMFKQEQASYLVGFVLGMASDTMHLFGYGYVAGVMDANPEATVQQTNANSFADPAIGKSSANAQITNGADIIYHAAGGTGNGVIEACQEAGVYAIGVDSDQSVIAPSTVITSAMKRVDNAVYDAAAEALAGKLEAGVKVYELSNAGVDIAPTQDLLTPEVIAAVEDVKAKIISGEIVVPASKEEFEAKYGDVYELD